MIDFHNHFLPNVDDGPSSMDISIDMLRNASKQGIAHVVQTVHYQHPKMEGKNVEYEFLVGQVKNLEKKLAEEKINIKISLSAEVFYLPNLLDIYTNPLVTIGNSKYMLIEFRTNLFPFGYEQQFYNLQLKGITPIIAHPERYRFIQNDIGILSSWKERGYIIQVDAGSPIGQFGKNVQDISREIIDYELLHLIGSDAHNNKKRNFCISESYNFIEKAKSAEFVEQLKLNVENLLNGNEIHNFEKNNKNKAYNVFDFFFKLFKKL